MAAGTLQVKDGAGNNQNISVNQDATNGNAFMSVVSVGDAIAGNKATVAQFHNADNQSLGGTAYGINTGGVAQLLNAAGNVDRQRETGTDLIASAGISTGSAQLGFEYQATSTTTVTAAATTATLSVANTTGFQVGGSLNFEPAINLTFPAKYEKATITAVVANTSVTIAFATGGALFTHTQPYTVSTFVYNNERDFSGEGPMAPGVGAAIATEFESNSGGPPLANLLPSGWTLDADRNYQGKGNVQLAISSTTTGDTLLTFTGNPWTNGLVIGQPIILSATAVGAAVEEVVVSKNNSPVTGAGPIVVNIVNPVVTTASLFAMFDKFALNGVGTGGATVIGVEDNLIYVNNVQAADPKKPLIPVSQAPGNIGAILVSSDGNKNTYRASVSNQTPAATPSDIFQLVPAAAPSTVRIKRYKVTGFAATTAGFMPYRVERRSSANTGAKEVAITTGKHDTNDAAVSVTTVSTYTSAAGNPTATGAVVAVLDSGRVAFPSATVGLVGNSSEILSNANDQAFVFRGTADIFAISLTGAAVPSGGVFDLMVEFEVDAS